MDTSEERSKFTVLLVEGFRQESYPRVGLDKRFLVYL